MFFKPFKKTMMTSVILLLALHYIHWCISAPVWIKIETNVEIILNIFIEKKKNCPQTVSNCPLQTDKQGRLSEKAEFQFL